MKIDRSDIILVLSILVLGIGLALVHPALLIVAIGALGLLIAVSAESAT